jgi:hypothetical protein
MKEKISRSDKEWRDMLTSEEYRVTRRKAPSARSPANTGRPQARKENILAVVVGKHFLSQKQNSIRVVVG